MEVCVRINRIEDVNRFVNILDKFPYSFDLESGRTFVDAKSPVGVISLAVGKQVVLRGHCSEDEMQKVIEQLGDFVCKE